MAQRRSFFIPTFLLSALLILPRGAIAADNDPNSQPLAGIVVDSQGKPITGVDLWLVHSVEPDGEVFDRARTDSSGNFRLMLPGRWVNGGSLRQGVAVVAFKSELGLTGVGYANLALPPEKGCKLVLAREHVAQLRFTRPDKTSAAGAKVSVTGLSLPSLRPDFGSPEQLREAGRISHFRIYETPSGPGIGLQPAPLPDELRPKFTGTTAADGSIVFPGLARDLVGSFLIDAEGVGRQRGSSNDTMSIYGRAEIPNPIELAAAGSVSGCLQIPDKAALRDSRVVVETRQLMQARMQAPAFELRGHAEVRPDAEGRFTVPALAKGSLIFHVHLAPGTPFLVPTTTTFPKLEPGSSLQVDVQLQPACRVNGILRAKDSGKPLAGVAYRLTQQDINIAGPTGYTDEKGGYFGYVLPGKLQRQFGNPKGYLPPNIPWDQDVSIEPGLKETTMPPLECERPLDLRVRVIDQTGKPRPRATVRVIGTRFREESGYQMAKEWTEQTDVLGELVLVSMDHRRPISVEARDGTAFTEKVLKIKSRDEDSVDLRVGYGKGVALSGRVVDGAGKPVVGVQIQIWTRSWLRTNNSGFEVHRPHLQTLDGDANLLTDADGRYRTPPELFPGNDYAVEAIMPGMQSNRSNWLVPEDVERSKGQVNLVAYAVQAISGHVRGIDGKPVTGARVLYTAPQSPNRETRTLADGSFRLPDVNVATGFIIIRQPGFRTHGKRLTAAERMADFVLARSDSELGSALRALPPPMPETERRKLAAKILEPLLQKALAAREEDRPFQPLGHLAKLDPGRALSLVESHPFKEEWYNDSLRRSVVQNLQRDSPEEALAIIESMKRAWLRAGAYLEVAQSLPVPDKAGRRRLLGQALVQARAESEAQYRVVELAQAANSCFELGDVTEATKILRAAEADAKALPTTAWAAYARGCFAESLARIDLPAALALIADLKDAFEFDRHHTNIAQLLAATKPEEAERVMAMVRQVFQRDQRMPFVVYRMAHVDPARAHRLVQQMGHGTSKARALGLLARARVEQDRPQAERDLREAFALLHSLVDNQEARFNNIFDGATVAASLLPEVERLSPQLVPEFLWETLALRQQEEIGSIQDQSLQADTALASMLARYDKEMARTLVEPWARDVKVDMFGGIHSLISAMTVIDPNWALATIESLTDQAAKDGLKERLLQSLTATDAVFWSIALRRLGLEFDDKEF